MDDLVTTGDASEMAYVYYYRFFRFFYNFEVDFDPVSIGQDTRTSKKGNGVSACELLARLQADTLRALEYEKKVAEINSAPPSTDPPELSAETLELKSQLDIPIEDLPLDEMDAKDDDLWMAFESRQDKLESTFQGLEQADRKRQEKDKRRWTREAEQQETKEQEKKDKPRWTREAEPLNPGMFHASYFCAAAKVSPPTTADRQDEKMCGMAEERSSVPTWKARAAAMPYAQSEDMLRMQDMRRWEEARRREKERSRVRAYLRRETETVFLLLLRWRRPLAAVLIIQKAWRYALARKAKKERQWARATLILLGLEQTDRKRQQKEKRPWTREAERQEKEQKNKVKPRWAREAKPLNSGIFHASHYCTAAKAPPTMAEQQDEKMCGMAEEKSRVVEPWLRRKREAVFLWMLRLRRPVVPVIIIQRAWRNACAQRDEKERRWARAAGTLQASWKKARVRVVGACARERVQAQAAQEAVRVSSERRMAVARVVFDNMVGFLREREAEKEAEAAAQRPAVSKEEVARLLRLLRAWGEEASKPILEGRREKNPLNFPPKELSLWSLVRQVGRWSQPLREAPVWGGGVAVRAFEEYGLAAGLCKEYGALLFKCATVRVYGGGAGAVGTDGVGLVAANHVREMVGSYALDRSMVCNLPHVGNYAPYQLKMRKSRKPPFMIQVMIEVEDVEWGLTFEGGLLRWPSATDVGDNGGGDEKRWAERGVVVPIFRPTRRKFFAGVFSRLAANPSRWIEGYVSSATRLRQREQEREAEIWHNRAYMAYFRA